MTLQNYTAGFWVVYLNPLAERDGESTTTMLTAAEADSAAMKRAGRLTPKFNRRYSFRLVPCSK